MDIMITRRFALLALLLVVSNVQGLEDSTVRAENGQLRSESMVNVGDSLQLQSHPSQIATRASLSSLNGDTASLFHTTRHPTGTQIITDVQQRSFMSPPMFSPPPLFPPGLDYNLSPFTYQPQESVFSQDYSPYEPQILPNPSGLLQAIWMKIIMCLSEGLNINPYVMYKMSIIPCLILKLITLPLRIPIKIAIFFLKLVAAPITFIWNVLTGSLSYNSFPNRATYPGIYQT